jgi:hypothetical protein
MPIQKSTNKNNNRQAKEGFFERYRQGDQYGGAGRISRPDADHRRLFVGLTGLIVVILVVGTAYFLIKSKNTATQTADNVVAAKNLNPWYAVKLTDGEIVFGKIEKLNEDPLTINPVYYNYDQKKAQLDKATTTMPETGDLRLVRRGGETHGPDGSLKVFRSQVVYMENLRADSKVLKVILENEAGSK